MSIQKYLYIDMNVINNINILWKTTPAQ